MHQYFNLSVRDLNQLPGKAKHARIARHRHASPIHPKLQCSNAVPPCHIATQPSRVESYIPIPDTREEKQEETRAEPRNLTSPPASAHRATARRARAWSGGGDGRLQQQREEASAAAMWWGRGGEGSGPGPGRRADKVAVGVVETRWSVPVVGRRAG